MLRQLQALNKQTKVCKQLLFSLLWWNRKQFFFVYNFNNKMHKLWYVWTFVLQINCEKSPKRNWWLIYHLLRPPDFQSCCEKEKNKLVPIFSIATTLSMQLKTGHTTAAVQATSKETKQLS